MFPHMAHFVRKTTNGKKWRGTVSLKDSVGDWRHYSKTFVTRKEAKEWAETEDRRSGNRATAGNLTVGEYLDEWFEVKRTQVKSSTEQLYLDTIAIIKGRFGATRLTRLEVAAIDTWIAEMTAAGLKALTIKRRVGVLRTALKAAVKRRYIHENPTDLATLPKADRKEIVPPTNVEVALIRAESLAQSEDFGVFVHLAVATGARRGELLALQWSDVDFETSMLTINKAIGRGVKYKEIVTSTKTGNVRRLSLDPQTVKVLHEYREATRHKILSDSDFIFTRDDGTLWKTAFVTYQWKRVRESLGLSTRFHDLRHFHATYLLSSGADLPTLAKRLGHAGGGRTTLAVYAHWVHENDRRFADVIGELFVSDVE